MSSIAFGSTQPASSGEIPALDYGRLNDVQKKHDLLKKLLMHRGADALLLQHPAHFAWLTSGGDNTSKQGMQPTASLFVTGDARLVACTNTESGQLFEKEMSGLGFQLKERPWYEDRSILIDDLCRGRKVLSDTGVNGTENVFDDLAPFRRQLGDVEQDRMRELARMVVHAVEATARHFEQHETEAVVAGQVAHRLIKREIVPLRIQVHAATHGFRYPHWSFNNTPIERCCVISAIGSRWGLQVGVSRTVCFGSVPQELRKSHRDALLALATGIYYSQREKNVQQVWKKLQRTYEKIDLPNEWHRSEQAELIGYSLGEVSFAPENTFPLQPGLAIFWHPAVGPASTGETILLGKEDYEWLTKPESWPTVPVEVKKTEVMVPGVLRRHGEAPEWKVLL